MNYDSNLLLKRRVKFRLSLAKTHEAVFVAKPLVLLCRVREKEQVAAIA